IRKQLFFRRKYVYLFFENLQRLVCMGLLQLGPVEKLKEKDMVSVGKRHATIVDTVYAEPHYWLVEEPPDKPFDRRRYTFSSTDDVDTYWFDLMCVCLNTPLGKHICTGSNIVCDDGTTPGDGKGAGGLSSEFFAHMKRNWLWTNHLLACKRSTPQPNSVLCRFNRTLTRKEDIFPGCGNCSFPDLCLCDQVAVEPSSRNQEVVGGKQRKRKRPKKEVVVKVPRKKKKEPKKRTPAHDEADHEALKKMTRRRVIWTVQEDSLLMLCGVASHLLNSKLRRTFVAYCVVRDLLQAEFQISEDKTSLAVGRRTRYILKNPQTFLNYRSLLTVVVNCSTADVHALVLFNLIQSTLAMTNNQMKESRSFQTFQIYSQYSQELLCRVFIECRKRHLVNQRRVCRTAGRKKNRALPILPMSFQLSQSYFRYVYLTTQTKLEKNIFTENRTESGEEAEDSRTTDLEHSGMMRFHLDSVGGACLVALTLMSLGLLSVHMSIPKKMVVVDSNLVDSDVRRYVLHGNGLDLYLFDDEDDVASDECLSKKKLRVNAHQASHTKYLLMKGYCIPGIVKRRNMNTSDNIVVESCVLRMQMRQTPACALLSDDGVSLDFSKSGPSLLPSVLTRSIQKVGRTPALCSSYSPEDVQVSAQLRKHLDTCERGNFNFTFSVFTIHAFRQSLLHHLSPPSPMCFCSCPLQDLQKDGQVLKVGGYGVRWVLIQHADPWILTVNPRNGSQLQAATGEDPSQHNIPFLYKRRRVEGRRDDKNKEEPPAKKMASEERLKEEEDKEAVWTIPPKAEDPAVKVSMGRECAEMQDECHPAEDKMEDEEEDGGASLAQEADIHEDSVSFVVRPWRLVDGTLNRQVCKGMLEAVLHHIMSRPGIPHQKLLSYYEGVLQPVVLLELLESLVELGCVVKKTLFKRPKPTLFGPPMPTTEEQQESVFYEPTVSCCLRLARVLPNERHWNYCGK
uniref:B-block binding subunit of TFIIIC domain-containing protein n=1 Tax=Hippocampus comes TaxID=109280 RepID=A0A3Q2Z6C9_HIPCM